MKNLFKSVSFTWTSSVSFKRYLLTQLKNDEWMHICTHTVLSCLWPVWLFSLQTVNPKYCVASNSIGLIFKKPLSLWWSIELKGKSKSWVLFCFLFWCLKIINYRWFYLNFVSDFFLINSIALVTPYLLFSVDKIIVIIFTN